MPRLTEDEFKTTMVHGMRRLEPAETPRLNLKPYVDAIPRDDHGGYDFSSPSIPHVYATPDRRFLHVLLAASVPDVFLVIVVDAATEAVRGHHVLDLASLYGLDDSQSDGADVTFRDPD
jgi:hypothetical protein